MNHSWLHWLMIDYPRYPMTTFVDLWCWIRIYNPPVFGLNCQLFKVYWGWLPLKWTYQYPNNPQHWTLGRPRHPGPGASHSWHKSLKPSWSLQVPATSKKTPSSRISGEIWWWECDFFHVNWMHLLIYPDIYQEKTINNGKWAISQGNL